jgi:hypothetical protein
MLEKVGEVPMNREVWFQIKDIWFKEVLNDTEKEYPLIDLYPNLVIRITGYLNWNV